MNGKRALMGAGLVILLGFGSCARTDEDSLSALKSPLIEGDGPVLRFQSYFFTAPNGYLALEGQKGAHVAGIFSEDDGAKLVEKLRSRRGFELMSAPALTSRNNERGKVEVIREFIYPTEYEAPQLPQGGVDAEFAFPVTPSTPINFTQRNVGLEAVFKGRKKGEVIDFEFEISRTSFLGFVNYGSPITASAKGLFGQPIEVVVTENRIDMPLFDVNKLSSKVSLKSGQYLAIGGLSADEHPAFEHLTAWQSKNLKGVKNLFVLIRVDGFE